jgi:hypothetical protein
VAGIVTVGPGERRSVRLTDRSLHGARVAHRTAASVLGTVGVAGIALGAVFGAMAIWSVTQQQSEHSPTLDRATAEYAAVAGGGLGAGAALLGTAVIVAVTTPEGQAGLEVSATGCPGIPRGLGLRLRW